MKYLKLYEEAGSPDFELINYRDWNDFIKNIVSFNPTKSSVIPSELKKEIKKTVVINQNKRRKITDSAIIIPSNNLINYLVIYVDDDVIFVYRLEDEYYAVYSPSVRGDFRFKCDQIEGVVKCINHIISIIKN